MSLPKRRLGMQSEVGAGALSQSRRPRHEYENGPYNVCGLNVAAL